MDFVTFKIAQKLKEKGFKEPCFGWYYPSDVSGYDYQTLIMSNRSTCRGDRYKDLLISHYDDKYIDAPTILQVLKWLRDEKKLYVEPTLVSTKNGLNWDFTIVDLNTADIIFESRAKYSSFEEAALVGIDYVLNNII